MYKKGRVNSNSRIISTDEDPSLRIESSAIINLRGVSTKLNKYIVFTMQTYKKLFNLHLSSLRRKFAARNRESTSLRCAKWLASSCLEYKNVVNSTSPGATAPS